MTGFHAHSGWWFEGLADGSVHVSAPGLPPIVFDAGTWASIIREVAIQSVSSHGDTT